MNRKIIYFLVLIVITIVIVIPGCKKEEVPVVTTTAVSNITATSGTSGGNITTEGSSTVLTRGVCWSTGTTPSISDNITTDGAGAGNYASMISNLFGGTTYFVRAYATNGSGTGYGMAMSFKTSGQPPNPPSATIQNATNIQTTSATLNATINANYYSTDVIFEYGTTTSYGSLISATQSPVSGGTNTNVSAAITSITSGTTYHYRAKAVNSLGTTYSADLSFTTLGKVPTVLTLEPTNILSVSAQINGTINPNYLSTTVTFEYGISTNYDNVVAATQSPLTGGSNISVSVNLTSLSVGTTYHYRAKAVNSLGTTYGADMSFTAAYKIGGNENGGFVFYIDNSGLHGLVCAPFDQSTGAVWGCSGSLIVGADGTAIGTGNQNTIDIINGCPTNGIAAKICSDLVLNTYSDWYLPSKDELGLMFNNLKMNGIGGFTNHNYLTSSEITIDTMWIQDFVSGSSSGNFKFFTYYVRAIRSF